MKGWVTPTQSTKGCSLFARKSGNKHRLKELAERMLYANGNEPISCSVHCCSFEVCNHERLHSNGSTASC